MQKVWKYLFERVHYTYIPLNTVHLTSARDLLVALRCCLAAVRYFLAAVRGSLSVWDVLWPLWDVPWLPGSRTFCISAVEILLAGALAEMTLGHLDLLRQNCRNYDLFNLRSIQQALQTVRSLCTDHQKKKFSDLFALADSGTICFILINNSIIFTYLKLLGIYAEKNIGVGGHGGPQNRRYSYLIIYVIISKVLH